MIVLVDIPSATTGPLPVTPELVAFTVPAMKSTLPSGFVTGEVMLKSLLSALVLVSVQVASPFTSVTEQADSVLLIPPAAKTGVSPGTGLLPASRNVTVTVEVATPSATTGPVPDMVDVAATAEPAVKVTEPSVLLTGDVIESVFASAVVEARVQVATPEALVVEHADTMLFEPVALKVGTWPTTGLLAEFRKVMVIVDVETPSACVGEDPVMVEFAAETGAG